MKLAAYLQMVIKNNPEYISKEQLCKICHMSKRTAQYLLVHSIIPCENNGKKTRSYKVKTTDLAEFMQKNGLSTKQKVMGGKGMPRRQYRIPYPDTAAQISVVSTTPPASTDQIYSYLSELLESKLDVLSVDQVHLITGYTKSTVTHWCNANVIQHFMIGGSFKIPKVSLIDYMISERFWKTNQKSKKHIDLMLKIKETYL